MKRHRELLDCGGKRSTTPLSHGWHRLPACFAGQPARRKGRHGRSAHNPHFTSVRYAPSAGLLAQRAGQVARATHPAPSPLRSAGALQIGPDGPAGAAPCPSHEPREDKLRLTPTQWLPKPATSQLPSIRPALRAWWSSFIPPGAKEKILRRAVHGFVAQNFHSSNSHP